MLKMLLLMWVKMFVANSFELKPIIPRSGRRLMCQVGCQPANHQLPTVMVMQYMRFCMAIPQ